MTVVGRDDPYVEASPTEDGIVVRVDFERRPDLWVQITISKDELAALATDAILRAKS